MGKNQFLRCFKGKLEAFVTVKMKRLVEEIMLKSEEDNQSAEDSGIKKSLTSFSLGVPGCSRHAFIWETAALSHLFYPSCLSSMLVLMRSAIKG